MVELFLIRHGQADSAGDHYDQLTETGHVQTRKIGDWLAANGYRFTAALHGNLQRQRQTLDGISAAYEAAGLQLPPAEAHEALAEFDLRVWAILAGKLRHGHSEFAALLKDWNHARHENAPNKGDIFKQLTGVILREWVSQGDAFTEAENFPAFQRRVLSMLDTAHGARAGEKVLAVTSGGPIALLTGRILNLGEAETLGLMRRIGNTSLHHFVFEKKWELVSFNNMPHLDVQSRTLV